MCLTLSVSLTFSIDHLLYLLMVLLNVIQVVLVVLGVTVVVVVQQGAPVTCDVTQELHLSS